jgi:hypothetical protein
MGQPAEEPPPIVGGEDVDRRYLIAQMTVEVGWLGKFLVRLTIPLPTSQALSSPFSRSPASL